MEEQIATFRLKYAFMRSRVFSRASEQTVLGLGFGLGIGLGLGLGLELELVEMGFGCALRVAVSKLVAVTIRLS